MSGAKPATGEPPELIPRRILFLALGVLFVFGSVGLAFSPWLLAHAPLLLLALNPLPRHVLMVAPLVDFLPLLLIVVLRRQASCVVTYLTAHAYGERALSYTERRRARLGRFLRRASRLFDRVGAPLLLVMPNLGAALAGANRMRFGTFVAFSAVGQFGVAAITFYLGDRFKGYILPLVEWVREHATSLTLATVLLVALRQLWRRYQRKPLLTLPEDPPQAS